MHYPKGHRRLDQEYVRILSQDHELVIVDDGKYFPEDYCIEIGVERLKVQHLMVKRWERLKRFLHYINLLNVFICLKFHRKSYDAILFLNIHNAIYFYKMFPKKKIVLFHHQDIDAALSFKPYQEAATKQSRRFLHICLAGFIKDGLIDRFNIDKERVFVVHQPLVFDANEGRTNPKEKLLIGIGRSTDETIVQKLIEFDKLHDGNSGNSIIMRSKVTEYKGKVLTVIKGFMPREEYEALYDRAKASVVTYPQEYKLRYSGIIDDSLSKGLIVFANDTPCSRYFSSAYPSCVYVFKTPDELWNMIQESIPTPDSRELKLFVERHSAENVRKQLREVINA